MGDDGQKSVCTQCVVGDHGQSNGNVIRNLDEVYDESKLHVERLIGELLTKISLISSSAKAHDAECNVIETKRNQVNGDVDKLFDALEATLRKRRAQLKERVDVICQERKSLTAKETDKLQNAKSDMEIRVTMHPVCWFSLTNLSF
ncbi:hypothetical protein DPMN_139050 [Dreissena polymorpha]|uniref:Uncharacterized protein n=1 Tax=Dreissena polymorpha TaxID=45954 RepID=A0A9D4G4Z5_DREPO|nr:hypothetical protein DPMN_139050 [Dreissena polymorpha]